MLGLSTDVLKLYINNLFLDINIALVNLYYNSITNYLYLKNIYR